MPRKIVYTGGVAKVSRPTSVRPSDVKNRAGSEAIVKEFIKLDREAKIEVFKSLIGIDMDLREKALDEISNHKKEVAAGSRRDDNQ